MILKNPVFLVDYLKEVNPQTLLMKNPILIVNSLEMKRNKK